MNLSTVKIEKPEEINFILWQSHFIKTVEDIHETLVGALPGIKFGLAFCEASGKCLIRWTGNDPEMIALARRNAQAIGAGNMHIIGKHILPLVMPLLVVNAILVVSLAILNESTLSFLGLGDNASCRKMISSAVEIGAKSNPALGKSRAELVLAVWRREIIGPCGPGNRHRRGSRRR